MSMRNVVGVLEDRPDRLWSTFSAAVELADDQHARLTLVKTSETSQLYAWCAPLSIGGVCIPPDEDPQLSAGRLLARAAEFVPMEIPLTTLVLGPDTQRDLCRLIEYGCYDALVASERFLRRARKLRRACGHSDIETVGVQATPQRAPERVPAPVVRSTELLAPLAGQD
jgi:hypothetical protein